MKNIKNTILFLTVVMIVILLNSCTSVKNRQDSILPGQVWNDTNGEPINAHGGGIMHYNGMYYWYGEYKKGKTFLPEGATWESYRTNVLGISCYSSKDLLNWNFEGVVLKSVTSDKEHDLHISKVLERPKVVYNKKTKKFVMWMHIDSADYSKATAGVAISDSPEGPFVYIDSFRPNGAMSRDQTLFVDEDDKCYQFYSSEDNKTMYISLLTDDYMRPSGVFTRNFIDQSREAPAVFKYKGKYYILTSGCTGWDPNVAELAVSDNILGPWKIQSTAPCSGKDADKTFFSQSTFVLPIQGKKDAFIAMFDQWNKTNLENSKYVWLPLKFEDGIISIPWQDKWNLDYFDKLKKASN